MTTKEQGTATATATATADPYGMTTKEQANATATTRQKQNAGVLRFAQNDNVYGF
jgi:hypothetical protein